MTIEQNIKAIVNFLEIKYGSAKHQYQNPIENYNEFNQLLINFVKSISTQYSASYAGQSEDWWLDKKVKYIFNFLVWENSQVKTSEKILSLFDFFEESGHYLIQEEANESETPLAEEQIEEPEIPSIASKMRGLFGHQLASLQVAFAAAEKQKEQIESYFNQLVAETHQNKLTYGQVLGVAIFRLFSLAGKKQLVNEKKIVIPEISIKDSKKDELNKLAKMWAYTSRKGGPSLSHLKREFKVFFDQIDAAIEKEKTSKNEHILNVLSDDMRVSVGLFLLAAFAIGKHQNCKDKKIRISENILTREYQQTAFQQADSIIAFDKEAFIVITNDLKKKAKPIFHGENLTTAQHLQQQVLTITTTPKKQNLQISRLKEDNASHPVTPKQKQIRKTELTPRKTNIILFYKDGSEQKFPIDNAGDTNDAKKPEKMVKKRDFGLFTEQNQNTEFKKQIQLNKDSDSIPFFKKIKECHSFDEEGGSIPLADEVANL